MSAAAAHLDRVTPAELQAALTAAPLPAEVDGLVTELRDLETLKCAIEARQAEAALALEETMRRRAADAGVPAARQGRGVVEQLAYARRVSPHRGRILLGLAKAVQEMPHLKAAFAAGRISEWRCMLLARETACLELVDRQRIDTDLAADPDALEQMGDRQLAGAARRRAVELDNASAARRRARRSPNAASSSGRHRTAWSTSPPCCRWLRGWRPMPR